MKKLIAFIIITALMVSITLIILPSLADNLEPKIPQGAKMNPGNEPKNPVSPGAGSNPGDQPEKPDTPSEPQNPPPDQNPDSSEKPPTNPGPGHPVSNPLDILALVNKTHYLSSNFVPPDLVQPDIAFSFNEDLPKKLMRAEAAYFLTNLFREASAQGISLLGVSGYRSYQTQKGIFDYRASQVGEETANRTSARPGQSEHQTGLAMDITSPSMKGLSSSFGLTREGIWVANNAWKYGFIVRYQQGKENITGYDYEPWHLRYVGVQAAQIIKQNNITFEEYLGN